MARMLSFLRGTKQAKVVAAVLLTAVFFVPVAASAQIAGGGANTNAVAQAAGLAGSTDIITIIGRIINIFLGFLGVIFLVLLIYAGFLWMTSGGDAEKVKKAQTTIRNAVIGLVIIASAWAIVTFVFNALLGTTGGGLGGVTTTGRGPGVGGLRGSSGSLGRGIIESHLPGRNATGIPRNTPIIITFKEAISPASFIQGWTDATSGTVSGLNSDVIKIYRTKDGETLSLTTDKARVRYTPDLKTFVIKPVEYLGSATNAVGYTVSLKGGRAGILKKDGSAAFTGAFGSGYVWPFEVSTVVDLTPPMVVSATPSAFGSYARNVVIQLDFNKAIDPTAVSGKTLNLEVRASEPGKTGTDVAVPGEFRISNMYQTVEFVPDVKCGMNSCGRDVFCLPGNKTIDVTAKAATIDPAAKPQAQLTSSGYDGVVDTVGNSLDGNKNGAGDGPPTDNYVWSFGTSDILKLTPPQIERTVPSWEPGKSSNVSLDQPVSARFDGVLQGSTVNSANISINAHGPGETDADTFWWMAGLKLLTASGEDVSTVTSTPAIAAKSEIIVSHRPYLPSGIGLDKLNFYDPMITSGVQDEYQNCFNPARACGTGDGGPNCCNGKTKTGACAF